MKTIITKSGHGVIVDDETHDWIGQRRLWVVRRYPYIMHEGKEIRLHRILMGNPAGLEVDHINRNPLDCRKENLRVATHQQNSRNVSKRKNASSKYKGVSWHASKAEKPIHWKWQARIQYGGKLINIGSFRNEEQAARAYDAAAINYFGEFAAVNFA